MNWIGFVVGAGTGIIAVLVSAGIMRLIGKTNSKGARILHIVVFAAAMALGREFVEPRIQAQQVESKLLEMPIYQVLQQYEPEAYMKIRATIEHGIANHQPLEQMWSVARPVMSEVTIRRLPHASDLVLIKFAEHIINATNILYSKGGDVCFSYINPAPGEAIDFSVLLGEDATQQELNLLAEVVTSSAGRTIPPVPETEAAPDIEAVIHKLRAKYTEEELASLQNQHSPDIDKRKYCQIIVDLFGEAKVIGTTISILLIAFLSSSPTNTVAAVGAVASAQSALKMTHAKKIMENPTSPFPSVAEVAAAMEKTTPRASGLCVSEGLKVETFSDYEGKQPTAAISDPVKSVGTAVVEDSDC